MEIKCNKCKVVQDSTEFNKRSKSKIGYSDWCKTCLRNYQKQYYKNNKEVIDKYQQDNKSKINEYQKHYRKEYYDKNRDIMIEKSKEYYINNKEELKPKQKITSRRNYYKDPEKHSAYQKQYHKSNPGYFKQYSKKRAETDINFKVSKCLRSRFKWAIKTNTKFKSSIELIGCLVEELKIKLEKQFKPEMNWDNYGKIWEIDHIIPCSKFNLNILEEQRKCFHYSNLQPLFKTTKIAQSFGYINEIGNRNKYNK